MKTRIILSALIIGGQIGSHLYYPMGSDFYLSLCITAVFMVLFFAQQSMYQEFEYQIKKQLTWAIQSDTLVEKHAKIQILMAYLERK
jgi:hypothetical protein